MNNLLHLTARFAFFLVVLWASSVLAREGKERCVDLSAWNHVPRPEWPSKAAAMVSQAKPGERESVARGIIKAAHVAIPRALPTIVCAMAAAVPELASVVASAASQLQPQDAPLFAKAAAAVASR